MKGMLFLVLFIGLFIVAFQYLKSGEKTLTLPSPGTELSPDMSPTKRLDNVRKVVNTFNESTKERLEDIAD